MSEAQMRRISYLRSIVKDRDAEIERLREALKPFVCVCDGETICIGECMHRNARAGEGGSMTVRVCPLCDIADCMSHRPKEGESMIDKNKTYRTRDGREVRIYATDGYGHYPVHGAYNAGGNDWQACCWTETGCANHREFIPAIDLIEVKPRIKREVWVNVYPDWRFGQIFKTKEEADECHYCKKVDPRLACVKLTIDVEEGEGL